MKPISGIASVGALLLLLAGCASGGGETEVPEETLPPASAFSELEPCPIEKILVEDLADIGDPGCDMVGSVVVFPDGTEYEVGSVRSGQGMSQYDVDTPEDVVHYKLRNFGEAGVGAMRHAVGEEPEHWATSETTLRRAEALLQLVGE